MGGWVGEGIKEEGFVSGVGCGMGWEDVWGQDVGVRGKEERGKRKGVRGGGGGGLVYFLLCLISLAPGMVMGMGMGKREREGKGSIA